VRYERGADTELHFSDGKKICFEVKSSLVKRRVDPKHGFDQLHKSYKARGDADSHYVLVIVDAETWKVELPPSTNEVLLRLLKPFGKLAGQPQPVLRKLTKEKTDWLASVCDLANFH